ncbi:MAG TPA: YceI family protein, partial [Blastocatellia bacterium]
MFISCRRVKMFAAASITLLGIGLLSPAAEPLSEGRYKINAGQSRFTVRALVGGLLSAVAGHDHTIAIRDFYGAAQFTYGSVTPASLQFTIKADSLAVTDKVSDSDRNQIQATMRNEVLDINSYPEITFKSTGITATRLEEGKYETRISGDLTLHGTTRPLTINAVVTFYATSLHADGQFALRQTEYGIKPVSVAGGTIKVKDELKFSFHIVAER